MNTEEQNALDALREAMRGDWRIQKVLTFSGNAVQVYVKPEGSKTYKKAGPLLFPPPEETVEFTLTMLGSFATK